MYFYIAIISHLFEVFSCFLIIFTKGADIFGHVYIFFTAVHGSLAIVAVVGVLWIGQSLFHEKIIVHPGALRCSRGEGVHERQL